jgi:hypothetical protein
VVEWVNRKVMALAIEESPKSVIQALRDGVTRMLSYACDEAE